MTKTEILNQHVRAAGSIAERLEQSRQRIGKMCSERRGPRMSIPVEWSDDDFFICLTLEDAIQRISDLESDCARLHGQFMDAKYPECKAHEPKADSFQQYLDEWAQAYPLEAFPEPDFAKARIALRDAGISLDCVSAHNMRHVINQVRERYSKNRD